MLNIDYKLLTKTLGQRLKTVLPGLINKDQNGFVPGGSIFFSSHTIRDILFYCKKENVELILLALDYSKAFDSVDFQFIHETFKLFNFGENFRKWIQIIYNGGKSCISNNGHISESFDIERSTRQGDPISPLVFILCLEVLFITLRSDPNIKGIKIEENEVKLTSYADDATYFMKNKQSTELLLSTIEKFSRVSGLEINRSKSECLLLNFELESAGNSGEFLGVPIVDNLKILGHYHGKHKLICDYQNFYSKLTTMNTIFSMWKQRHLTLFGKNLLINALCNSLFLFNAQIDKPPCDFIKLADAQNKNFLWGGTPKIAHHSIVAEYDQGGMKYKDLNSLISSINLKFITKLASTNENHTALPKMWIKSLFKIPNTNENEANIYFSNYFSNYMNVLDCKFKMPRQINWKGHPFYYDLLKNLEFINQKYPSKTENILSIPIWFNSRLSTKFDVELSRAGFNFLKDLFPNNQLIEMNQPSVTTLRLTKRRLLIQIILAIPEEWGTRIESEAAQNVTVLPAAIVNVKGYDIPVQLLSLASIYTILIESKVRPPRGLLRWCEDLHLSDSQIKTAFMFAHSCSSSIFDRVFQYKIVTQILPTNEYLHRYRVRDTELCTRCGNETDTVLHSTWACVSIVPYIAHVIEFLRTECGIGVDITMIEYLFGFQDNKFVGLNHLLLELKKELFYNWVENVSINAFFVNFKTKIMHLMIKEKQIALSKNKLDLFIEKWKLFVTIYDFMGPDCQILY